VGSECWHRRLALFAFSFGVYQPADVAKSAGTVRAGPPLGGVDTVALVAGKLDFVAGPMAAGLSTAAWCVVSGSCLLLASSAESPLRRARVVLPQGLDLVDVTGNAVREPGHEADVIIGG